MSEVQEVAQSPFDMTKEGQRHIVVGEYSLAVEVLAKACEQLAQKYGDKADECAEAYYWYGKALLALSREERGVLGGVMSVSAAKEGEEETNDDEKMEQDEDEKGDEEKAEADKNEEERTETKEVLEEVINKESVEVPEENKDAAEAEPSASNGEKEAKEDEAEGSDEEGSEDEDDVENLQLAWEMLELSRGILQQRKVETRNTLLADVLLCLGEVALESETYDKAVSDMMSCLEIQKKLYDSNDRRIAETYYQIGLANSLASNFDDSITHYQNAVNILESCIKQLQDNPGEESEKDIQQIRELIPEIQEKIQDVMECKAEAKNALRESLCATNGASTSSNRAFASSSASNGAFASSSNGAFSSSNGPSSSSQSKAADISHLVKRKRQSSGGDEGSASKRTNKSD